MSSKKAIPTPFAQKLKRARVGALPLLIWCGAVFLAIKLWFAAPSTPAYLGLAVAPEFTVASPVDGELGGLLVELYQTVRNGEAVATMNDTHLQARIATARSELDRLAAELESERARLDVEEQALRREAEHRYGLATSVASLEFPAELRAFHTDEAEIDLRLLEARLAITTSEFEADRMEVRLRRARALAEGDLGPRAEVVDLEKRLQQERGRKTSLGLIEAGLKAQREQGRERRNAVLSGYEAPTLETFLNSDPETRLAGWKAALVVQQKRMNELALSRESYLLRAPAAGKVAALVASQGQFLLAGDPILVLTDSVSTEVALWVPESSPTPPRVGDHVRVRRALSDPTNEVSECVVQAMSPRQELTPQRLWRDPRRAEYGRACLLGPVSNLSLIPGERVYIDLSTRQD